MQPSSSVNGHAVSRRTPAAQFGDLLRQWRGARRLSQLALAEEAGISGRHLSFLESGRSSPSREMVRVLCLALDVPLLEHNKLLLAAGFSPDYRERDMAAPELASVRRALDFILAQQEPYPALVVDAQWNVKMSNSAARAIFGHFYGSSPEANRAGANALRTVFDPIGIRQYLVNWEEFAGNLVQRLHAEAATAGDPGGNFLNDLLNYPGVPANWRAHNPAAPVEPLLTMKLRKDETAIAFFSTLTTFSAPFDVTLQQLKIECFYPADFATEAFSKKMASHQVIAPQIPSR